MKNIEKYEWDVVKATMEIVPKSGRSFGVTLVGLNPKIIARLALVGVITLLDRRQNPEKSWAEISAGKFERVRDKTILPTVRAMATVFNMQPHEAHKKWASMTKEERTVMKKEPDIQHALIDIRAGKK